MYAFAQQLGHYFDRPHIGAPTTAVGGAAAWTGSELNRESTWIVHLEQVHVEELRRAVAHAQQCGRELRDLRAEDFPLPNLAAEIARWRHTLVEGRGFVVVRGFPVVDWTEADSAIAFWALGLHLGVPGEQNEGGDLLGHVIDVSAQAEHDDERLYRTNQRIRFHCDAADVVGLMCLSTASAGGASRLVSSVRVFDELVRQQPELAARLFEPMLLDARQPPASPIQFFPVSPCAFDGSRLRTFMHQDYFRSVERHPGAQLDAAARAALDAWESYAESPGVHFDMQLEPGDVQLVNNHTVVHARTAYVDAPDAPRHLLRLWLSLF